MYKLIIRPFLFFFPAEKAHQFVVRVLNVYFLRKLISFVYQFEHPSLEREFFGLSFKNPIGLAAGFDKNAESIDQFCDLGFAFIEVGTLTPKAQGGNAKPRLFRLKKDNALINRMGFNNDGVKEAIKKLRQRKSNIIIGANIAKNRDSKNATKDYITCFNSLFDYVDYFSVNVSSPNTKNLRDLQEKNALNELLSALQYEAKQKIKSKAIFLKIAPDLNYQQIDDIIDIVQKNNIDGIIATNTTVSRDNLLTQKKDIEKIGEGGLSGKILFKRSTEIIRYIRKQTDGEMFIIAVGGINSAESAIEKLNAGASLIQIYTGLVYEGPKLIKSIKKNIVKEMGIV